MTNRFETFTLLVAGISRSIRKIKTKEVSEYNLKSPHVSCLYYLDKKVSLTAKELCDLCDEDKGAISRTVDYLEDCGLVKCNDASAKRYKSQLMLTDKGKEIAGIIANKIDTILDKASQGLTEDDRVILYKSLALIDSNLKKICDKYGE